MAQRGYGEPTSREWGSDDDDRGDRRDRDDWRDRDRERSFRSGDHGRRDRDDERGIFERAGDEVRSWFGASDEDERRREGAFGRSDFDTGDTRRYERDFERGGTRYSGGISDRDRERSFGRIGRGGTDYSNRERGFAPPRGAASGSRMSRPGGQQGFQGEYGSYPSRERGREDDRSLGYEDYGRSLGGFGNQRFGRPEDQFYHSWRERQMSELDRDYADYCREREQSFHQDFDEWRRNRPRGQGQSGLGEKGELQLESGMQTGATGGSPEIGGTTASTDTRSATAQGRGRKGSAETGGASPTGEASDRSASE